MKKDIESFEIMLNELNSSLQLNQLRKNKIEELEKEIEELKRQNICLKNDLISVTTIKSYK
jgi:cupin superfamily acireductone dioxygenase involved in methionine salvage